MSDSTLNLSASIETVTFQGFSTNTTDGVYLNTTSLDRNASSATDIGNGREEDFADLVTAATLQLFLTVVNGLLLPVLVLCGVTGNVINMAVFLRQGLRDRVNVCLFSLAVSDTGFNLFHYASRIYALFYLFDVTLAEYWESHGLFFVGVYLGFRNTSYCLTLIISLERCICVMCPLRAKRLLSARQMAVIVLAVFTVCLVGTGIGSFKYKPVPYQDPVTNLTHYRVGLTDFYLSNRRVFDSIFEVTFNATVSTVAFVVVIAATIVIAVRMRSVLAWRQETAHVGATQQTTSSTSQREAAVTRMLLVVCVVFTVCTTPGAVEALVGNFVPELVAGGRYNNVFFISLTTLHFMESFNCSINFIIYYTMSTRFRETLKDMVHRKDKGKVQATSIATISHSSVTENKL